MRKLRRSGQYDEKLPALMEAERKRDYSDADDQQQLRYDVCTLDTSEKQKIFESYLIPEKWKQTDFGSSVCNFYNAKDRKESEHFADMWIANLENVEENFHRDYFAEYFESLRPDFLRRQSDVDKLKELLAKLQETDKNLFKKKLTETIAEIEELIQINPN